MNRPLAVLLGTAVFLLFLSCMTMAAGPKISDMGTPDGSNNNKHNLSSRHARTSGFKASTSDPRGGEICIFCHTPHNATSQVQLWNRFEPSVAFGHFSSPTLVISHTSSANYNEPTGASRLCLSCHDGVTAGGVSLGNLASASIAMMWGDKITGTALFTSEKIRTGHHPVSFVYDATVVTAIENANKAGQTYKLPALSQVKLDRDFRMQCTTCHDPHQNQSRDDQFLPTDSTRKIAPFWVYGDKGDAVLDHDEVCKDCHNFMASPWPAPSPWPPTYTYK